MSEASTGRFRSALTGLVEVFRGALSLLEERDRKRFGILIGLAVVVSLIEAISALLVYAFVQMATQGIPSVEIPLVGSLRDVLPNRSDNSMFAAIAVVVSVVFIARGALYLFQTYIQQRVAHNAGVKLSSNLVRGYLEMPYEFHLSRNSAELIRNVYTAVLDLVMYVLVPGMAVLSEGLIVVGLFAALLVAAPAASALAIIVIVPVVLSALAIVAPRLRKQGHHNQEATAESIKLLQQGLGGVREIKLGNVAEYFTDLYQKSRQAIASSLYNRALLVEGPRIGIETMAILLLVVFLSVRFTAQGSLEGALATLGLFAYAVLRTLPSLNRVVTNVNSVRFGAAAVEMLSADLTLFDKSQSEKREVRRFDFRSELCFESVDFTYEGEGPPVLRAIHFTLPAGGSLGVIGPTGSGKSTLIDLLLGLIEPRAGRVTVDGRNLVEVRDEWQAGIGMVPQSVFLLDDTLRRNVAFGSLDADINDDLVVSAINAAQLAEFVASLPGGLDTVVGERGVRLSGGQRQRIAIARALYQEPRVLVFDEATSALDPATERNVIAAISDSARRRTLVLVAHRLSTVASCDLVLLLKDGSIADAGRLDELVGRHPELGAQGLLG